MISEPTTLPELDDNPFIAGLGPPPSVREAVRLLREEPRLVEGERALAPHLRRYCALRLLDFVHPRMQQVELVERVGMVIRQGYKGRNPALGLHRACILDAADRREAKLLDLASARGVVSMAPGFVFTGHPGMGKTLTMRRILASYPQVLRPVLPESVVQVSWLLIECPSGGTKLSFCTAFLTALGKVVGKDYCAMYKGSADKLTLDVQSLCHIHAIGVVVVDEIQHLAASREGPESVMNFLVTLVNTIGIPVILVGTMAATPIIEKDFREARRAAGLGQPNWMRLQRGEEWDDLVKAMWKYQWTREATPFSTELGEALYDESQGIIDVAVKIFLLCQHRVIWRGENVKGAEETITPDVIGAVAAEDFKSIRPMIAALRDGREDVVARYDDLRTLHAHLDAILSRGANMTAAEFRAARDLAGMAASTPAAPDTDDPLRVLRDVLAPRGIVGDVAEKIVAEARRRHPSDDPLTMMGTVMELVEGRPPAPAGRKTRKPPRPPSEDPDDLRVIAAAARTAGTSIHAAFVDAGVIATVEGIVAA